jgi:F0F1-type ATP synthase assembly protein I
MSFAQRKATEFLSMLKQKRTEELTSMRTNLLARLKSERAKTEPDQSTLQNLNWQLSLIGRELSSRKPADQKEPMQAIADDQELSVGGTVENPLKSKTLDDLNKMLVIAEKELADFKVFMTTAKMTDAQGQLKLREIKVSDIKTEISTRSPKAQEEAKKDIDKSSLDKKWSGIDTDMITIGALTGVIGGAIGWGMGKKGWTIAGFVVLGIGVGAGGTFLAKKIGTASRKPAPNV